MNKDSWSRKIKEPESHNIKPTLKTNLVGKEEQGSLILLFDNVSDV